MIGNHRNSLGKSIQSYTKYYNSEPSNKKRELSKSLYVNRAPSNEESIKG